MMKGLVYVGKAGVKLQEVERPKILCDSDAIIKVTASTICGSDLSIIRQHFELEPGKVLGHEGVGIVDEVGAAVKKFKKGDRVIISSIQYCGNCVYCRRRSYSCCPIARAAVGIHLNGTQAEYVRVPYGDNSLYNIPEQMSDEVACLLSDILPTSYELGIINGQVRPGCTVAIFGLGPIGLCNVMLAGLFNPKMIIAVDMDENRLEMAKKLGATHIFNKNDVNVIEEIMKLTRYGVDVAIEAAGTADAIEKCQKVISIDGTIANVGVHEGPSQFYVDKLSHLKVRITFGIVDTWSISELITLIVSGKIDPTPIITHRMKYDEFEKAYELFDKAIESKAIKIILTP